MEKTVCRVGDPLGVVRVAADRQVAKAGNDLLDTGRKHWDCLCPVPFLIEHVCGTSLNQTTQ